MLRKRYKPILAITMGDPSGIGPEVIVKALSREIGGVCPCVIGDAACLARAVSLFAPTLLIRPICNLADALFQPNVLNLLQAGESVSTVPEYGKPTAEGATLALHAMAEAVKRVLSGEVDGITTAPIHKANMQAIGFPFPGHTEFFADAAGTKRFGMMMVGGGLKIMLVTIHLPLKEMIRCLNREQVLETIRLTDRSLRYDFAIPNPRIAVAALNPHGGEGGILGNEEFFEIAPAVSAAQAEGIPVEGPFPADTLFFQLKEGKFDAAVAIYHDQALIPIKLLAFGGAVNVTVGLPFVRTSVDHGTAYNIAGQGVADAGSLTAALECAAAIVENRKR